MSILTLLTPSARVIGRETIRRHATRRMITGVTPQRITVRSYGTGVRPPGFSLAELIGNTVSFLSEYLSPAAPPQATTPATPAPAPVPVTAPDDRSRKEPADPWAGEATWTAVDRYGIPCDPGRLDRLYRTHGVPPEALFRDGMPAPGDDFDLRRHQGRTVARERTNDAFYGACHVAVWGDDEGPAFDTTDRYMSVIKDGYGYAMPNQLGNIDIAEMETVVHMVPPHKIVAVLDKHTGEIHLNPANPQDLSGELTEQLRKIWEIGLRKGIYRKPEGS
ncbi:hypothetical protein [Streptosporangium longisporum]|uniref:Uncharacterized protein n=1 Tax=Streptosporangium longisporum TaxID=46187 RepID=A0ABP6LCU1_9ACTN